VGNLSPPFDKKNVVLFYSRTNFIVALDIVSHPVEQMLIKWSNESMEQLLQQFSRA
jgi:hypothetical protein